MTRSPGWNFVTLEPTWATIPAVSVAVDAGRGQQVVFDFLEIGVADAAGFHTNEDLTRADFGRVDGVDGDDGVAAGTAACMRFGIIDKNLWPRMKTDENG